MSTARDSTRERILTAARALLVERSYHGTGIDEIARAAGVTRQAVYGYHFGSKAELLTAMVDHVDRVEGVAALFEPVERAKDAVGALRALVRAVAELWPRIGDLARVLDGARHTDPAAEAAWRSRAVVRRRGIGRLMARVKLEGLLAPGWTQAAATDLALGLLSPQLHAFLVGECGWTRSNYVTRVEAILVGTLVRTGRAAPAPRRSTRSRGS